MSYNRFLALVAVIIAAPAEAYIGPGAGLGTIGTAVAFLAAILLLLVGFIWYPLKRLLRRRKADASATAAEPEQDVEER